MIKEKVINNPSFLGVRVAKWKKIEYLYFIPYNLVLNGATELDTVVP